MSAVAIRAGMGYRMAASCFDNDDGTLASCSDDRQALGNV